MLIQLAATTIFFGTNHGLEFDRAAAYGMRLNIAAGTAVCFKSGEDKNVSLVVLASARIIVGCNGLEQGALDDESVKAAALQKVTDDGFGTT